MALMLQILSEILDYGEEKASSFSTEDEDIERQEVDVSEFNGKKYVSSSKQQYDGKLQAALLSLCVMICNTMISADTDLGLLFNKIGTGDGGDHTFNFVRNLKEMVERISSHRTAESLAILKLTTNMVTSMMQHRGSYANDELDSLMVALSNASKALSVIDGSMVFASQQDDGTMTRKTAKTLASLVKEAQELVDEQKKNHFLDIVPA
uniref:Uncharacterized protein n=1 Tax=Leersia perrieri TaxID=77586 RepID=A0A0D9Y039_9ORYZ